MELFMLLTLLMIGCLKAVNSQEPRNENAENQQHVLAVSSLPQGNNKDSKAAVVSSVTPNSELSNETLMDLFNAAKNISHSKGIYQTSDNEVMLDDELQVRRSIRRKVTASRFTDVMTEILQSIVNDVNQLVLLNDLENLVHEFDVAVNFANVGGIEKISPLLFSSDDDVASSAAMILGAALQSNPKVQQIALKQNLLPDLLKLFSHKSPDVLSRGIFALASLLRNSIEAQVEFIANRGVSEISKMLKSHLIVTNAKLKIINLLNDLAAEQLTAQVYPTDQRAQTMQSFHRLFTSELKDHGVCKQIPTFLDLEDFDTHQKVVSAMISLDDICHKDFQNEGVVERINHLIKIYNPDTNDGAPFYPAIDVELKIIMHSELKSLETKINSVREEVEEIEYTKEEL